MKGFASLIGLLIAALILIIVFVTFYKSRLQKSPQQNSIPKTQEIQNTIDNYQQKSIQTQLQEIN